MELSRTSSTSSSPTRRISIGSTLTSLSSKLRSFSLDNEKSPTTTILGADGEYHDTRSISSAGSSAKADRSQSRGREVYSYGRGGAGNMRQTSGSRDARPTGSGPTDDHPKYIRGRELAPGSSLPIYSTGRGGAGNFQSPSRDPGSTATPAYPDDHQLAKAHRSPSEDTFYSSGRGGAGNIHQSAQKSPSQSRSRSRSGAKHSPSPSVYPPTSHAAAYAADLRSRSRDVRRNLDAVDEDSDDKDEVKRNG